MIILIRNRRTAEDSPSDDMGRAAARSDQKINRQLPLLSARINAKGRHFEHTP